MQPAPKKPPILYTEAELTKAMNRTKIHLLTLPDQVFLAHIMCRTKHTFATDLPTAATDGVNIYYNPNFFMETCKTVEDRAGLMVHEQFHIMLEHCIRFKEQGLIHGKANRAADYYINLLIDKIQGITLPQGGLLDAKYEGWSFMQIYNDLPDKPENPNAPWQDLLDPAKSPGTKDMTPEQISAHVDEILVEANGAAERAGVDPGHIPGDLRRYIDKLLNPKVPWFRIYRRFMSEYSKTNYSMSRPNRRFFPEHILPTLHGESLCEVATAVDTSGSVTDQDFECYISENIHILNTVKPKALHFLQFDTKIKTHDVCRNVADLKAVEFKGRGGTNIRPVMQWAEENKPKVLTIFTDGYFSMPDKGPKKVPVIWIIVGNPNFTAPFGKVVHYDPTN